MKTFKLTRDVTTEECWWLHETIKKNTIVYECIMSDYGCCTDTGTGCTFNNKGDYPFFELPNDSLAETFSAVEFSVN